MRWIEQARELAVRNLPLVVFGVFYFLTSVLVNILYAVGIGRDWPREFILDFSWSDFSSPFGLAFWILVLCPFAALPVIALPATRMLRPLARWASPFIAEFPKLPYAILCSLLYAYVAYTFAHVGAAEMFVAGKGAVDAVVKRFALQAAIGFHTRVIILSLLYFLAIYASVKAIRRPDRFWKVAAILEIAAMLVCLVLLNMKWPVILFILTLGFAVFVTVRRFVVLKTSAVMLCGIATYFVISVVILHAVPPPPVANVSQPVQQAQKVRAAFHAENVTTPAANADATPQVRQHVARSYVERVAIALANKADDLTVVALSRMGMAIPYYYDIFTAKGPFCGSFFDWALHTSDLNCRPSLYIYNEMFHDRFKGKGTAPAAFQIYEYAREGWPGVFVSLLIAGLLFGAFMSLRGPAKESDMIAAIFIMGAPVAYTLSQLPIEGAIIYDNGIVWWGALVILNALLVLAARKPRRHGLG